MKKYTVVLHPDAETDISSSYEWGCQVWGEQRAKDWARELRRAISFRLTSLPLRCQFAAESDDLGVPIRQLIVQRYRVLFIVQKKTVTILHVRGPYVRKVEIEEPAD